MGTDFREKVEKLNAESRNRGALGKARLRTAYYGFMARMRMRLSCRALEMRVALPVKQR